MPRKNEYDNIRQWQKILRPHTDYPYRFISFILLIMVIFLYSLHRPHTTINPRICLRQH